MIENIIKLRYIACICYCIFLSSCFVPLNRIAVSPHFNIKATEAIILGIDDWCEAGVICLEVVITSDKTGGAIFPSDKCDTEIAYTMLSVIRAPRIHICEYQDYEHLRRLVRHEIGHALAGTKKHLSEGNTMCGSMCTFDEDGNDVGITESDKDYVSSRLK